MTAEKTVPCNCCGDPIVIVDYNSLRRDIDLGVVCDECHHRLRVAQAWLKHNNVKGCQEIKRGGRNEQMG